MDPQVRRVTSESDIAIFRDLVAEYEQSLPAELQHTNDSPLALHVEPNTALIAFIDDVRAGCVALKSHDPSAGVMQRLYVVPAFRGCGVARALVTHLIEASRKLQQERVVLDTDRDRLNAAYKLYLSLGFSECAPYGTVDYPNPTYMELKRTLN